MKWQMKLALTLFFICLLPSCRTVSDDADAEEKKLRAARINTRLGIAYLEQKDIIRAKQKLVTALDEGPSLPEAWYAMGYFLESTGNRDKAKEHYLKAIALAPKRGDTHNNYGTFLCRSGQYVESIQHFMLAVQDPRYLDPASAYENAALCALKIPDVPEAEQFFAKALAENPDRPTTLLSLAELKYKQGNYSAAKISLDRYMKLGSPSFAAMNLRDKIYARI